MEAIRSSYQFHRELESPVSFVRREWQAITIFGGVFVIVLLIGVLAVEPAYFYPRLGTDPLLYYLKALAFIETGSTVARTAINRRPFNYVAMPGIMRAPFIMMFSDFDNQLRAIQLSNIVLVTATALIFAYILSWAVPRSKHWIVIGFTFGFMLLSPNWVANVFEPLADAPYAAFSLGALIVVTRLLTSDRPIRSRPLAVVGGALAFVMAFMVKFTAPVLAVYAGVLAAGRERKHLVSNRVKILATLAAVGGFALLVFLNWTVITKRYLPEPIGFLQRASKPGMILNLMGNALPAQIIPVYHQLFENDPIGFGAYRPGFATTPSDIALTVFGFGLSLVIFYGMWRARHRFLPEIWYFLAALPVLTVLIPSTRRYMMPYQPLIQIFFYVGATGLLAPLARRLKVPSFSPLAKLGIVLALAVGLIFLRSQRLVGSQGDRRTGISIGATRGYVNEVSSTFGDLRRFLETLPKDRTLLIGAVGTMGRWKVISDRDYYFPDSLLHVAAREKDIYVLLECGTREVCQDFEHKDTRLRTILDTLGRFTYDPVFRRTTRHARVVVYRLRNPH